MRERAGNPVGQLRAFVSFDRRLFELGGDVMQILAEGRRQHPELDAAYQQGRRRGDRERRKVFSSWPATVWRPGVDVDRAVAAYGITVSLGSFHIATREYDWSPDDIENWWLTTLAELVLGSPGTGQIKQQPGKPA